MAREPNYAGLEELRRKIAEAAVIEAELIKTMGDRKITVEFDGEICEISSEGTKVVSQSKPAADYRFRSIQRQIDDLTTRIEKLEQDR